jgi:putative salt-induced outer membrane protein YdiY
MFGLRAVAFTSVLVVSLAAGNAEAQPAAPPQAPAAPAAPELWRELTIGGGFQVYSGDADTLALGGNLDWSEQFRRIETEVSANTNVSHTFGDTTHHAESVSSATRWLAATHRGPRLYPMGHLWYQHDENAGVDLRVTAGGGIGSHLFENARVKFTLEGGLGHTVERALRDGSFVTIFVSPIVHWRINERTQFSTNTLNYFNSESIRDVRLHNETDFNVQITQRVGLQNSLLVSFDNVPETGHNQTSVQFSVNIAFTLSRAGAPQP